MKTNNSLIVMLCIAILIVFGSVQSNAVEQVPVTSQPVLVPPTVTTTPIVIPNSLPMLASRAALRGYAVELGRNAKVSAWSSSRLDDQAGWSQWVDWKDSLDSVQLVQTVDRLINNNLSITVANTKDYVSVEGEIRDVFGNALLNGYGSAQPEYGKGGYFLPTVTMQWDLAYEIVLYFPWARNAEMLITGPDGYTRSHIQVAFRDGVLRFRSDFAGAGILVLTTQDGWTVAYDLSNQGVLSSTASLGIPSSSYISDIVPMSGMGVLAGWTIESKYGVGVNPTIELTVRQRQDFIIESGVFTTEGAKATGLWVRRRGEILPQYYPAGDTRIFVGGLSPGVYYIWPAWNRLQFRERDPVEDARG